MSITKYSIRYPFLINYDEDTEMWYCEPFTPFEQEYATYGSDLLEALQSSGDLALLILEELTEEQKEQWRGCYDPDRPNIYLVLPRYYCCFCESYDECAEDCAVEYVFTPEDDDDE